MSGEVALCNSGSHPMGVISILNLIFTLQNQFDMRILLLCFLFVNTAMAQVDPVRSLPADGAQHKLPAAVLRQLDSATIWEGVRIKTEQVFGESGVEPSFKIKNKEKRKELVAALEGQFQVNIADSEIRSFKRAATLSDNIFQAQKGIVMFSKAGFQGKVERLATHRTHCKENADCLNFIGALIVPKGYKLTLYNQPKFKGEQLSVDASNETVRIHTMLDIPFGGSVSTTNKTVNWREEVHSLRTVRVEK